MKNEWPLQDAKNHLSEVVNNALHQGPQVVTRRGVPTVVVLSNKDYLKLKKTKNDLLEFFQSSPLYGVTLDLIRDQDSGRDFSL